MRYKNWLLILKYGLTRAIYPRLERVFPKLADFWARNLFLMPARFSEPAKEKTCRARAKEEVLHWNKRKIATYTWGEGPIVLFVHGWAGRGPQFRKYVQPFVDAGYQVLSFDAPAHGRSSGFQVNLIEIMDFIRYLNQRVGPFEGIVGHSLGGAAGLLLAAEGLPLKKLVLIATPCRSATIMEAYFSQLNGSLRGVEPLKAWIDRSFGFRFDKAFPLSQHKLPESMQVLLAYDRDDDDVPCSDPEMLAKAYPTAQVHYSSGFGHSRILKDKETVQRVLAFMRSE